MATVDIADLEALVDLEEKEREHYRLCMNPPITEDPDALRLWREKIERSRRALDRDRRSLGL